MVGCQLKHEDSKPVSAGSEGRIAVENERARSGMYKYRVQSLRQTATSRLHKRAS